ncbi:carbonic anhydrase [Armillaria luteobubalina]|uniref:Carbonic anhydrase n=1 Tax=Armillaria luteobubalina TaxID=153913 RepID=A0AA39UPJ3_9AGAR|nr:carbonic anhydrase [Armillaria luteobubalina]
MTEFSARFSRRSSEVEGLMVGIVAPDFRCQQKVLQGTLENLYVLTSILSVGQRSMFRRAGVRLSAGKTAGRCDDQAGSHANKEDGKLCSLSVSCSMICLGVSLLVWAAISLGNPIICPRTRTELDVLSDGNGNFRSKVESSNPGLLEDLAVNGQHPEFMFLGCSDSRVSEGTIFDALPGMLFAERNIANQFHESDDLGVQHIIIMGHYGCGGASAAIASPPSPPWDAADFAVQEWIFPLRKLYAASVRREIIEHRNAYPEGIKIPLPKLHDPVLRALVEENVKQTVFNIVSSQLIVEVSRVLITVNV